MDYRLFLWYANEVFNVKCDFWHIPEMTILSIQNNKIKIKNMHHEIFYIFFIKDNISKSLHLGKKEGKCLVF